MSPKPTTIAPACALLLAVVTIGGCQTSTPGVTNTFGTYATWVAANPQDATAATQRAMSDLDLIVISHEATALDGRIIARTARDKSIKVNIEKVGDQFSKLKIRVGFTGDEGFSMTILQKIEEHIAAMEADE